MKPKWIDWVFVIFTDECSFWQECTKPKKIWTNDSLQEIGTGTHEYKVHCWGAISAFITLPIQIFKENLNKVGLLKILRKLLPQMKRLYPEGFFFNMATVVSMMLFQCKNLLMKKCLIFCPGQSILLIFLLLKIFGVG